MVEGILVLVGVTSCVCIAKIVADYRYLLVNTIEQVRFYFGFVWVGSYFRFGLSTNSGSGYLSAYQSKLKSGAEKRND